MLGMPTMAGRYSNGCCSVQFDWLGASRWNTNFSSAQETSVVLGSVSGEDKHSFQISNQTLHTALQNTGSNRTPINCRALLSWTEEAFSEELKSLRLPYFFIIIIFFIITFIINTGFSTHILLFCNRNVATFITLAICR